MATRTLGRGQLSISEVTDLSTAAELTLAGTSALPSGLTAARGYLTKVRKMITKGCNVKDTTCNFLLLYDFFKISNLLI